MMKYFFLLLLLLLAMTSDAQSTTSPIRQIVRAKWEFRQAEKGDWMPVKVPASIHTALLENKKIEDPFYRDNESRLQWIEATDWEFQCTFQVDDEMLQRKHLEIHFKGLDTYAHVYLNDSLILETNNMFRSWTADVKNLVKPGNNALHIYFESPVKKVENDWKNLGYELPGGIRTMSRKAQFHYGWDWGPKLVGAGILNLPEMLAWDDFLLEDVYFTPLEITDEKARVLARYRYRSDADMKTQLIVRYDKVKSLDEKMVYAGVHEDSTWFDVPNPRLWWCNGMGEPYLYDFSLELKYQGRSIEKADVRSGIRTIELVTTPDDKGQNFYFKLNGKPVFAKGANYIPQDMFQDRVAPGQYKALLDDVVASNMNMLRVWGGGIYEEDLFYQLCDARGIMVWQDFMYACALYPGSGSFLKNAAAEAYEQIVRLRSHPCMALFCGNNENNEAWNNWGWQMQFNESQRAQLWRDYTTLFVDLLPTYVSNYGAGIPYWESSPKYGRANPKSLQEGDAHYWGVWHDEEPFSILDKKVPRFMSEFGFQSFPEWRTIVSFTEEQDRELESPVMLAHQKHPRGNALIAEYMKRDYRTPKTFEDFVYVSQLLQAEGMRTGIEAHRRNKPYCMGTLYWQLNDVWPVASWSSIDYYGRWKAMQYYVREIYKPVAALPIIEDNILKVYGVSDLMLDTLVNIRVRALSLEGKLLSDVTAQDILIHPDSSKVIWQGYLKTVTNKNKADDTVIEIVLSSSEGTVIYRRLFYLVSPKDLALSRTSIDLKVEPADRGYKITVQASKLTKNVYLQTGANGFFSDNYFDLLPGERKTVWFKTEQILDSPQSAFTVKHLEETY
ncbi:MAG: glycoside hydrolase family 2 protein [Lewinellaceae bacterium]|nr:glycoside hydrolase family 2 protein [Lewinellaceae bacterium]